MKSSHQRSNALKDRLLGTAISLMIMMPALGFGQNLLRNPEHIAYDHVNQRYLVTNYGNGTVVSIDQNGTQQVILSGLNNCMGIHIQDTILMISYGKKIRFLDLNSLRQYREVTLNTSTWLDGMITDNQHNVYVVENGGKIFRVNLDTYESTTIVTQGIPLYPQDLAFDAVNNRLIVVSWDVNSPIKSVNLADNSVTTLQNTQLGNFDGVVRDSLGNLYVSCHRNGGKVYRIDGSFQQPPVVLSTGLLTPAGLCLNDFDNVLAVPNFDGNSISYIRGIYTGIELAKLTAPVDIGISGEEMIVSSLEQSLSITIRTMDGKVLSTVQSNRSPYQMDISALRSSYCNQPLIISVRTPKNRYSRKIILWE
jgi:DNA-binding beta-propeller fold protein YncE